MLLKMGDYRNLTVYKKAFESAMAIYEISKSFLKEELFSMTTQIRKSSRSVCVNLGEGYRKRKYSKHFVSKLTDSDMENSETIVWLEFALACQFIDQKTFNERTSRAEEVGRMISHMIDNPDKYR